MTTILKSVVSFVDGRLQVQLANGVAFSFPIAGNRRLERATPEQLVHVEVDEVGLHWPEIDEDLSFAGLLRGDWGQELSRATSAKSAKGGSGMKIVKWTRGLDCPGTGKQTQRYHAFGDDFPGMPEEEYSRLWADAERVVVDCIRRNGFKFDGNYHQYGEFGMPLFDDGTVFFVSWRHWGHLMYRAWNPDGNDSMGYCKYAFGWDIPEEEYKYPQSETDFLQPDEVGNEGAA